MILNVFRIYWPVTPVSSLLTCRHTCMAVLLLYLYAAVVTSAAARHLCSSRSTVWHAPTVLKRKALRRPENVLGPLTVFRKKQSGTVLMSTCHSCHRPSPATFACFSHVYVVPHTHVLLVKLQFWGQCAVDHAPMRALLLREDIRLTLYQDFRMLRQKHPHPLTSNAFLAGSTNMLKFALPANAAVL